jgi:CBS domain-containing protein
MSTNVYIREVMSHPVVSVTADVALGRLATILVEQGIGAVPVVDGDGRALGVVAEADLVRATDTGAGALTAADVMSAPAATVRAADGVDDALRAMRRLGIGRLPVVDDSGRVVGIVSGSDLRGGRPSEDVADARIRCRVIDRVIDLGGEVLAVSVDDGVVRLRIRIGTRGEIPLVERLLGRIPGVVRLELIADPVGSDRSPAAARR